MSDETCALKIDGRWWLDTQGQGPVDGAENIWAATVSVSLRLDAVGECDCPSMIFPLVAGTVQFDGDSGRRRLHQITANRVGLVADDVLELLVAVHDVFGAPEDDDISSTPIDLDAFLKPVFRSQSADVAFCLKSYKDWMVRDGVRHNGRTYPCRLE
jgi:hypothetical protein